MDDKIVKLTREWVNENRRTQIEEVRLYKKRKYRVFTDCLTVIMGMTGLLIGMSWFGVGIRAKIIGLVAITSFSLLILGRDEE